MTQDSIQCNVKIAILMATYNGEKHLQQQVESLLAQSWTDWHLYIHDDGSTDQTTTMLASYAEHYPDKITLLDYPPQGGACRNFLSLLDRVSAPFYMFCDQDDVWLPQKIEVSLLAAEAEERLQPGKGVVVCTDLFVVDEHLHKLYDSLWSYLSIYPEYIRNFLDSGASAVVTGCTMLFNQQAKECCQPYCPQVMMHDCWLCLCVLSRQGVLRAIRQQLVYYRQHGDNSLGAGVKSSDVTLRYRLTHFKQLFRYNLNYYHMLSALGYGSLLTYLKAKWRYRHRIRRGRY